MWEELHQLVDQLPEERLAPVLRLIRGDSRRARAVATLEAFQARLSGLTVVDEELSRLRGGGRGWLLRHRRGGVLRWFADQDGYEHARELLLELLDGLVTGATADFARVAVAGVLRKKGLLAGRLTPEDFASTVRVIDDIGVTVYKTTRTGWNRRRCCPPGTWSGCNDA
jgi:hypothetical protein